MHLGELADVICGPFGSAITNKDYQESGIPLIRITNISGDGYMDYSDIIYISEELGNSLSRTQVSAGDIVISQRGSLGQCAIVDDTFPKLNISANIIAIKNPKGISAEFIRNYILSAVGQTLLERASSGQVQQKITTQDIANLLIPNNCNEEKLISIIERGHTEYEEARDIENEALGVITNLIIQKTKGHGLAKIVDAILRAKGFTTYVSPAGPDKGVDILASAGTLGFGSPKICVQVKSTDTPVDRIVLDQLGGVMKNFGAEYGLLVSWRGFKSSVINETAKQFFEIRLWTHKEIIEEFLRYYDQMDDEIKELIPLKKIWVVSNDDQ